MENFIKMAEIQSILLIYLLIGVICRKMNVITDTSREGFNNFVMNVLLPIMIFMSFSTITSSQIKTAGIILLISTVISFFSYVVGKLFYSRYPISYSSVLQYGSIITNSGFAGLPMVSFAYGNLGLFYASLFIIPTRILMWTVGISLFTTTDIRTRIKNVLLNPGIIAVELGLIKMIFDINLPLSLNTALSSIGNSTMSTSMILIGTMLSDIKISSIFEWPVISLSFVRLVLLPGLTLLALNFLNVDPLIIAVSVLLTAMPVASVAPILAQKYGSDFNFASKTVFMSTVLSLITVPILSYFMN